MDVSKKIMSSDQKVVEPEKVVDIETFKLSEDLNLIFYSGTWCGPCSRIKPFVYEHFENKRTDKKSIPKDTYKKMFQYVPQFVLISDKDAFIDAIQTSDSEKLKEFLSYHNVFHVQSLTELEDF
jgi:thiol-disulfide isomerase/thioredoxin